MMSIETIGDYTFNMASVEFYKDVTEKTFIEMRGMSTVAITIPEKDRILAIVAATKGGHTMSFRGGIAEKFIAEYNEFNGII